MTNLTCWNGHSFSTDMGPGVRGVRVVCLECGAGVEQEKDGRRLVWAPIHAKLIFHLVRDGMNATVPVYSAIPSSAEFRGARLEGDTLWLLIRDDSFPPVKPMEQPPEIPPPVFQRIDRGESP
jgi:hypothetical protein